MEKLNDHADRGYVCEIASKVEEAQKFILHNSGVSSVIGSCLFYGEISSRAATVAFVTGFPSL